HQGFVRKDRIVRFAFQPAGPEGALLLTLDHARLKRGALVDPEQALGVGRAKWPCRGEEPPRDCPDMRDDQEKQDAARHRSVELGDAVPFVAGRVTTGDGISLYLRHGLSS